MSLQDDQLIRADMTELQALVEFSVELHKFYNVDLFQRGYYQVRCTLRTSPKLPVRVDVSLPPRKSGREPRSPRERVEVIFPACTVDGTAVSKTFHILYRNDEVILDDIMLFRAFILVDSHKIEETLERADFTLLVELWFTDEPFGPGQQRSIESVCARTLRLHFLPTRGLHDHVPLLFDYSHLAAVTMTIHAALVALHQPHVNNPRSTKPWLGASQRLNLRHPSAHKNEPATFGNLNSGGTKCASSGSGSRLAHARHVHQEVCSLLLAAYEALQTRLVKYMKLLPHWQRAAVQTKDCLQRFNTLSDFAKGVDVEEEFAALANKDIAQLCAENIMLWQKFLDAFSLKEPIHQHLAKVHHQLRVRRFAEAFFVLDNPRHSAAGCYDANYQNYLAVSEMARRSRYLAALPPLPIQCVETDGDIATLPIIFEDQYQEIDEFARRRSAAGLPSREPFEELQKAARAAHPLATQEDCSCGISAILESRANKRSGSTSTSTTCVSNSTHSTDLVGVQSELQAGDVIKATLTLQPQPRDRDRDRDRDGPGAAVAGAPAPNPATLPGRGARHSKSLDQLRAPSHQTLPNRRPRGSSPSGGWCGNKTLAADGEAAQVSSRSSDCLESGHPPEAAGDALGDVASSTESSESPAAPLVRLSNGTYRRLETSASVPFNLSGQGQGQGQQQQASDEVDHDSVYLELPPARSTVSLPSVLASLQDEISLGFLSECSRGAARRTATSCESMPNLSELTTTLLLPPSPSVLSESPVPPVPILSTEERSPPSSSVTLSAERDGDVTSEQSGWVSHSSRRSSRDASSGQLSPDTDRDVATVRMVRGARGLLRGGRGEAAGEVSGELLRARLKELTQLAQLARGPLPLPDLAPEHLHLEAVPDLVAKNEQSLPFPFPDLVSSSSPLLPPAWFATPADSRCLSPPPPAPSTANAAESNYEELQLPPPSQFCDDPPPPEPFRDALPTSNLDNIPPPSPPSSLPKMSPSKSSPSLPVSVSASVSPVCIETPCGTPAKSQSQRVSPSMGVRAKLTAGSGHGLGSSLGSSSGSLLLRRLSPRPRPAARTAAAQASTKPIPAKRHKFPLPSSELSVDAVDSLTQEGGRQGTCIDKRPWRRPIPITSGVDPPKRSPKAKVKREVESGNYKFQKLSNQSSSSSGSSSTNSSTKSSSSRKTEMSILPSESQSQSAAQAHETIADLQDDHHHLILSCTDHEAIVSFAKAKEEFKRQINFSGMIYSDFATLASTLPYFAMSDSCRVYSPSGLHLVVCVHGLSGNSYDLRLVKAFLELGLPGSNLEFIMSERNSCDTQTDFDTMGDRLVTEILYYVDTVGLNPARISFVGHSLGNVIIRAALAKPRMKPLLNRLHTFLSLVGPHLGTLYNSSGLVNMGVWLLSRLKGSDSIVQLSCRDASDLRQSFMYKLSQVSNLHLFKNVLLCGSSQDRYVPLHSARIELCKAAVKDTSIQGTAYREMVQNILHPIINNPDVTFVRYDVHHSFSAHTADALIGRAAHIAVLDSEKFLEKFLMVVGLKYFR